MKIQAKIFKTRRKLPDNLIASKQVKNVITQAKIFRKAKKFYKTS